MNFTDSLYKIPERFRFEYSASDKTHYHYTTLAALTNIIENNEVWITDAAFMNDTQELKHGLDLSMRALKEVTTGIKLLTQAENFINFYMNNIEEMQKLSRSFVFSLTLNRDMLNQWTGYAQSSLGVAIGFDLVSLGLTKRLGKTNFIPYKVIYDRKIQEKTFLDLFKSIIEFLNEPKNQADKLGKQVMVDAAVIVSILCTFFKNDAFSGENELRFIKSFVTGDTEAIESIKFRFRDQLMIPYIPCPLKNSEVSFKDLITEIILPHSLQSSNPNYEALGLLLLKSGIPKEVIKHSTIPYRH